MPPPIEQVLKELPMFDLSLCRAADIRCPHVCRYLAFQRSGILAPTLVHTTTRVQLLSKRSLWREAHSIFSRLHGLLWPPVDGMALRASEYGPTINSEHHTDSRW